MMSRIETLRILYPFTENIPVISACGATSREWASLGRRPNHLYVVDTMGLTPSIALGVSLAIQDSNVKKCIALEGDGGVLMNPNALASAAYLDAEKWLLIILDNECFASTGGQRALSAKINVGSVAAGHGLKVLTVDNPQDLRTAIETSLEETRPIVIHVKIAPGNEPTEFINDDPAVLSFQFSQTLLKR
jgi:sulfopyruvate decarboxylase subunit beta